MKNITIAKIQPNQWEAYKEIRLQGLMEHPVAFSETYQKASGYADDVWIKAISDPNTILLFAFQDEKVIGSIGTYFNTPVSGKKTAIPFAVYVSTPYKGMGIGKQLMAKLIEEIGKHKEVKQIKLWVAASQLSAMSLYKSFGFTLIGKEKEQIPYEGKLIDELIMEKIL